MSPSRHRATREVTRRVTESSLSTGLVVASARPLLGQGLRQGLVFLQHQELVGQPTMKQLRTAVLLGASPGRRTTPPIRVRYHLAETSGQRSHWLKTSDPRRTLHDTRGFRSSALTNGPTW